jgi:aspartyl-tRNA(Asn)/glutamyl-tRNA(Gln) amidotransferase subunit A
VTDGRGAAAAADTLPSDPAFWTIAELAERYRARQVSPVEVTRALLARIERLNPHLNAYIAVTGETALAEAGRAERELQRGLDRGPLQGVPTALKDLIDVAGVPTTCGSAVRAGWVPSGDASVVERLRAAGAVLIGKANLHEFAYGATNDNPHYGTTRNPWDPTRITGGSSGGSAAAAAAGLAHLTLGSDTGGSIRIPAALCGLVGLRPTFGRVPLRGAFPLSWSHDTLGPLVRSVEDAAIALQALAGHDRRDATTAQVAVPDYGARLGSPVRGLRVGVLDEHLALVDPPVRRAFDAALGVLRDIGVEVVQLSWPGSPLLNTIGPILRLSESTAAHFGPLREAPERYGADVRARLEGGVLVPATAYVQAQRAREVFLGQYLALFERVDVLAGPTAVATAPPIGASEVLVDGQRLDLLAAFMMLTRPYNIVGAPSITQPCGFDPDGLPIGLQFAGRPWGEPTILRLAYAYERATDWHRRHPALASG